MAGRAPIGIFAPVRLAQETAPAGALRTQLWLKQATVAELRCYVAAKQQSGALDTAQSTLFSDELEVLAADGDGFRPSPHPKHWGAFVVDGE